MRNTTQRTFLILPLDKTKKMKAFICLLVANTTVALAFQSAGRFFHAVRRSNFHLATKISFRKASRFAAVAVDRDSGRGNGNCTSITNHLSEAVPEPAVSGNVIGWNTDTQRGTNSGAPTPFSAVSPQPSIDGGLHKATSVLLANAVHGAQRIPTTMGGLSSVLTRNRMTFVNVTGEGETLEVCHFPRELGMFPSFFDTSKQLYAVGSDLIFRRIRPVDEVRFEKTMAALKKGRHAIWCGHPGIGMSTEANFVLLEFLRHLGDGEDSEWPTKVAHRVEKKLYLYTWNAGSRSVECDVLPGKTLDDVEEFIIYWRHQAMLTKTKPPVLFLELEEDERDPKVSIPTFITLHSSDVKKTLKTMDKGGGCVYFLVRPHERDELLLMAKVMFEADPEQLCARLECEREWDKVAEIVSSRMDIVGPLVRHVFCMRSAFDSYAKSMEESALAVVTSPVLAHLSVFNIPATLQFFVAPYSLKSADPMEHEFKFLSHHAILLLANSAITPEFLYYAAAKGLDEQFTEEVLSALLRDTNVPTKWRTAWEWHRDPGYAACISMRTTSTTRLETRRRHHVRFKGSFYECDAQQLDGDTLYQSRTSNFCMGESRMFTAEKDVNGRTVAINMFQTPTSFLLDRPFTVAFLNTTMDKFGLFEPHNANVSLHLICVVDKSRVNVKGLKFKANDPTNDTVNDTDNGKDMNVDELRRDYPEVGNRLKTFVVRKGLYNDDWSKMIIQKHQTGHY